MEKQGKGIHYEGKGTGKGWSLKKLGLYIENYTKPLKRHTSQQIFVCHR